MDFQEVKANIESLIEREDTNTALHMIDEVLNNTIYPDAHDIAEGSNESLQYQLKQKWELYIQKSLALEMKGSFLQAINQVNQVLDESKHLQGSAQKIQLKARIVRIGSLFYLGKIGKCLLEISQAEEQIQELVDRDNNEWDLFKGLLFISKGQCAMITGEFEQAKEYLDESLQIFEKSENNARMFGLSLYYMAFVYSEMGDYTNGVNTFQESLEFNEKRFPTNYTQTLNMFANMYCEKGDLNIALVQAEKAVKLAKEQGNPFIHAFCLRTLGKTHYHRGELNKAMETLQKSIKKFEETQSYFIAWSLRNLGQVYQAKGELDQAQVYLTQSLDLYVEIGYKNAIAWTLQYLGQLYREKGYLQESLAHFQQGLSLREELGNDSDTSRTLFDLILLNVEIKELEDAKFYLQQLKEVNARQEAETIAIRTQLSEAVILKQSNRIREKAKAQSILLELVENENVELTVKIYAYLDLCDLLLYELRASGDREIFSDIYAILNRLNEISTKQSIIPLVVRVLLLKAKILLLEGNIEKSKGILDSALLVSSSNNLQFLTPEIEQEQEALTQQIEVWQELVRRNAPMAERIKWANMVEYLEKAKQLSTAARDQRRRQNP